MLKKVTIGIDIGGTNTVFGLVDSNGKIHNSWSIPTNAHLPAIELLKRIKTKIDSSGLDGDYKIIGLGIGAPNGNYYTGYVENPPNLSWGSVNLTKITEEIFKIPVSLTNDANAAALGEMLFGAAKGMTDFIEITLGTGLGSGIVVNGKVLYGSSGFAGELGHVIVKENGRQCGCGRRGCLETYASASGIKRTAAEILSKYNRESSLRKIGSENLTSEDIFEAAVNGDKLAKIIFDETGGILGKALADAAAILSPQAIILFGGLALSKNYIFEPTIKSFNENLLNIFKETCKILPSELPTGGGAILGSAALVWNDLKIGKFE